MFRVQYVCLHTVPSYYHSSRRLLFVVVEFGLGISPHLIWFFQFDPVLLAHVIGYRHRISDTTTAVLKLSVSLRLRILTLLSIGHYNMRKNPNFKF
jgi:hypothetical protein